MINEINLLIVDFRSKSSSGWRTSAMHIPPPNHTAHSTVAYIKQDAHSSEKYSYFLVLVTQQAFSF